MSTYNGRRAPNVSQYIANLNTIPSPADADAQQQDFGNFQDDLDLFTNTQFFDFDITDPIAKMPTFAPSEPSQPQQNQSNTIGQDPKGINFVNPPNFQFPDFAFSQPQRLSSHSLPPSPPNGLATYPPQHSQPSYAASPATGEKRNSTVAGISSPADFEDPSRHAAEEDKRRRNTAASARFRVKKKQREQALEKSAKEMSDKVQFLEARVGQLEMENKWLKGLITEKNLKGVEPSSPKKDDKVASESSSEQRTDGVGTESAADKVTA